MNQVNLRTPRYYSGLWLLFFLLLFGISCQKTVDQPRVESAQSKKTTDPQGLKDFTQVNLVGSDDEYSPQRIDPNLKNGWGLSFSPGGIAWVSAQATHVSVVYRGDGSQLIPPVHIPSPGSDEGGNPSGNVFNPKNTDFVIPSANANPATGAAFIFAGLDGVISAWNGTRGNHAYRVATVPGAVYTGITIASNGGNNLLYAANFSQKKIDVWDASWNPVSLSFTDPNLPDEFSPFNIQNVNGKLYVMYAELNEEEGEEEKGAHLGYVDIYNPDGSLDRRFVSQGQLNAPWGVAWAPPSFFGEGVSSEGAILIGNFGDGHINAYSVAGDFLGQLRQHGQPIVIEGLWAIMFPPATSSIDPNRLYFAAGPEDEEEGLFGYIAK
jgi:uncharacterized protein (TIGR03118 family)